MDSSHRRHIVQLQAALNYGLSFFSVAGCNSI